MKGEVKKEERKFWEDAGEGEGIRLGLSWQM
jgi:hypothetical protein